MRSSVNQTISHHLPSGTVTIKSATLSKDLASGARLTLGAGSGSWRVYEAGLDVFYNERHGWAFSFAEAINANPSTVGQVHNKQIPNGSVFARAVGDELILIGRVAGDNFTATAANGFPTIATILTGARADNGASRDGNKNTTSWTSGSQNVVTNDATITATPAIEVLIQVSGDAPVTVRRTGQAVEQAIRVEPGDSIVLDLIANTNEVSLGRVDDVDSSITYIARNG